MAAGWEERSACRDLDPEFFYPAKGDTEQTGRAKAVCAGCPVREACLAATLDDEKLLGPYDRDGVRGGLNGRERYVAQHGGMPVRRRKKKPVARRAPVVKRAPAAGKAPVRAAQAPPGTRSKRVSGAVERPECGTRSGYFWHIEHYEIPCEPCTAADLAVTWFIREGASAS
jgi:hypothetical protein